MFLVDVYKGEISVIDPAASTFIASLPAQTDHGAIMTSGGKIYFIDDNHLISLDVVTGQRITLTALQNVAGIHGMRPVLFGVTPDGQRIVVAHIKIDPEGTGSGPERIMFWLSVHNASTGTFLRNIPPEPEHVKASQDDACAAPQMIFAPDNRTLYEMCILGVGESLIRIVDLILIFNQYISRYIE